MRLSQNSLVTTMVMLSGAKKSRISYTEIAINWRHRRLAWARAVERFMTLGLVNPGEKNPPYPPLEKGGGKTAASLKSPFFKGGFRGI